MSNVITLDLDANAKDIEANCQTSVIVEGLKTKSGKVISSLSFKAVCNNFIDKTLNVLKELGSYNEMYWIQKIMYVDKKEMCLLTLSNNTKTSMIFDTFKKLGINLTFLKVGYSSDFKTLYLTNKMLRDLRKFGGGTLLQISMYLLSIVKLFDGLSKKPLSLNYEPGTNTVTVDDFFITEMDNYIYQFVNGGLLNLEEMPTEDIKNVLYYNTAYSRPFTTCDAYMGTMNFIKYTSDSGEEMVNLLYNYGAKALNTSFIRVSIITGKNIIMVNNCLNILDLDMDSIFSLIARMLPNDTVILQMDTLLDEKRNYSMTGFEEEDGLYAPYKKLYDKLLDIGVSEAMSSVEAGKLLGITFKSIGMFDSSSIKASYDSDEYAQELYKQVQPYYETFDLKNLSSIVKSFAKGDTYSMMLYGASGTGKSTCARVIPYRCGLPYVSVNFSTNIEESDLIGTFMPNKDKKSELDPPFVWKDGILTKAIRNGYVFIGEEINFARPGILSKLNSLLDEFRQIDLPTGEIVKAHPNFRIIATCNIAYEGTNRFNKALINRFELIYEFEDLTREETINIIISRTGYSDRAKIEKILNVYDAIKKYSTEQNLSLVVSLRQLLNLFKQGKYFKNAKQAVIAILINNAFIEESEYKANFIATVLAAFDLKFKL